MSPLAKVSLALVFGLTSITGAYAAADTTSAQDQNTMASTEVRNGFTVRHAQVMITQNGKTEVMADNMKLADGIEIRTDGTVIVPGGTRHMLSEGDTLTFDGTITRASGKVEHLDPH